jgi:hypothetical protein
MRTTNSHFTAFGRLCSLLALACASHALITPDMSWQANYAHWRSTDTQPASEWFAALPTPNPLWPPMTVHNGSSKEERQERFYQCLDKESAEFIKRNEAYKSPDSVQSVRELARAALDASGRTVTIAIFWGRERYVKILWKYLERNLAINGGIVDKIVLAVHSRQQDEEGTLAAARRVKMMQDKYPGIITAVEMCPMIYGCVFDETLTDNNTVYVKMDDDIIFIKDGSIEHLVLQVLRNPNYSFYSGSIVNNPHSVALHKMIGAYPPVTYHWSSLGRADRPFVDANETGHLYYGRNMYDTAGSQAHESFIYNVGRGRLDLYNFDLWNMNACRCGKPQERLNLCKEGFYRWAVNVFAYLREPTLKLGYKMPPFDEPVISVGWTRVIPPHRVAIVGESLFVHYEVRCDPSTSSLTLWFPKRAWSFLSWLRYVFLCCSLLLNDSQSLIGDCEKMCCFPGITFSHSSTRPDLTESRGLGTSHCSTGMRSVPPLLERRDFRQQSGM